MINDISDLLGANGPFIEQIDNFSVREQQQQMARAIERTITADVTAKKDLIVEAGTGTGKTFAYLVPTLSSGKKVIISTGTKNLQDQLFKKDIPLVRKALKLSVRCALLKGRSNYLCLHRLRQQQLNLDKLPPKSIKQIDGISGWARTTQSGDISEYTTIPENDMVWPRVTSTSENCIGQDCGDYQQCHVMLARREAQAADLLVINHHLLLSDMSLPDEGFGDLLPSADVYVIDEAHQLADIAANFFGVGISSQQFIELGADTVKEYKLNINEDRSVEHSAEAVQKAARDLHLAFGAQIRRSAWHTVSKDKNIAMQMTELDERLTELKKHLLPLCERSAEMENCYNRAFSLQERLQQVSQLSTPEHVHWFEVHKRSVSIHLTPLNVANAFQEKKQQKSGRWVFTSATLSVAGGFEFFARNLGLSDYESISLESPFDYAQQALLYLPTGLPDPNDDHYTTKVVTKAIEALNKSQGHAFFLFTSFKALNFAHERLKAELRYPLFVQGEKPRDVLLEEFRRTPNAVLLGTNSFWEGVDVRGDALTCVIIDKLPFASPNDPVFQARLDALKEQGINPFMQYQLPKAVIMLKQGVGRLIRDANDYGVLMICDPRLKTKAYGKTFLNSLPKMPQTDSIIDVHNLYLKHREAVAVNA